MGDKPQEDLLLREVVTILRVFGYATQIALEKSDFAPEPYPIAREIVVKCQKHEQATVEEILSVGDKLLEMLYHVDFSNGVEASGMDEGRVIGYKMMKDLESDWQVLKSKYLKKER